MKLETIQMGNSLHRAHFKQSLKRADVDLFTSNFYRNSNESKEHNKDAENDELRSFEWRFEFPEVLDENGQFEGFDAIVGNPPYGVHLSFKVKEYFKTLYENVHVRTPDTYIYFTALAFKLLKPNGYLGFIVPNNSLYQLENQKLRKLLLDSNMLKVVNLGDGVFNKATVPTCVFIVGKEKGNNHWFEYADIRNDKEILNLNKLKFQPFLVEEVLKTPSYIIGIEKDTNTIIEKMRQNSVSIDEIAEEVASGISTGADKVFRISTEFAESQNFEKKILKPILVGRDINKYLINASDKVLIYTHKKIEIEKFPNIYQYLQNNKEQLSQKRETKNGTLPFWCLHWHRKPELFENEKIIIRQTADTVIATFDSSQFYTLNSILVLVLKNKTLSEYKFVLAILNSKATNFVYKSLTQEQGRVFAEVKPQNIRKLFIPNINSNQKEKFVRLVDKILKIKKMNPDTDTSKLEGEIDALVYQIYNLTEDEIASIEK